jgi:FixJ family two-component response regulator
MTEPAGVVFVVDDDVSVREALGGLIRSANLEFVGFASAEDFLSGASFESPACLVLDVRMPGLSGLQLQRRLSEVNREIPIIFITGHGDVPSSVQAMKEGAVDFLIKPFSENTLLEAIGSAIARDRNSRSDRLKMHGLKDRYESLTAREKEVMGWVVAGLLNKQVAAKLGITEITVKAHRAQVMRKMQADSLASLVRASDVLRQDRNRPK